MAQTLKFKFQRAATHITMPVHGVWGGLAPLTGNILADVFIDRAPTPTEVTYLVDGNSMQQTAAKVEENTVTREVMATLEIPPHVAYAMGEWLMGKAKEAGFKPVVPPMTAPHMSLVPPHIN